MFKLVKTEVKKAFVENKFAIIASTIILFISLILGYLLEPYLYSYFNPVVEDLTEKVQTGVIQLTFQDIFLNNIMIVLQMFIFGLLFCFSALILAFNGFFVGYYTATSPNLLQVLLLTIPHGIFEFSSCILACASGFVLFNFIYRLVKTFLKEKEGKFFDRLIYSYDKNFDKLLQAFILLALASVLMIIAGIIEAYITLPLAEFLFSLF
ncbi:stage II sporulation protein M [uncultured Methanobrevibacter sp.]|uniref:stage II sporulation protein M n=1 Tax=uncultured Methanobrevibacter sp. TaxID=253161 RepID=UPI0025D8326F|nr:stage II sporulation protein M [uncultured Methanobrevibacter sp.]